MLDPEERFVFTKPVCLLLSWYLLDAQCLSVVCIGFLIFSFVLKIMSSERICH